VREIELARCTNERETESAHERERGLSTERVCVRKIQMYRERRVCEREARIREELPGAELRSARDVSEGSTSPAAQPNPLPPQRERAGDPAQLSCSQSPRRKRLHAHWCRTALRSALA
jgi:hypothetical protein